MIDLHCHILPGIDDGAAELSDSLAMAEQAQADGVEAICATPHIRHDHDVRIGELPRRLAELQEAVTRSGCRVRVLPGGEVAATALDGLSDEELRAVTLGATGSWILLEPAPGPLDESLDAAVAGLRARGFRSLIAHPERHMTRNLIDRLQRLVGAGALVQATAAFVAEEPTRTGMLELAAAGVIHVLGSDSHSSRVGRPPTLRAGLDALGAVGPLADHLDWIAEIAPAAIVAGKDVRAPF